MSNKIAPFLAVIEEAHANGLRVTAHEYYLADAKELVRRGKPACIPWIERDYPAIQIPDEAFVELFGFFDTWDWTLDYRPLREGNEINPDVLGYLFEQYINQKQMGAYYTKEDITGYITRNALLPFVLDEARRRCPESSTWSPASRSRCARAAGW